MTRWVLLSCVLTATACYRVQGDEACTVRCDQQLSPICPSGLTCGADNLCHAGTQCDQLPDGPPTPDAPDPDATILPDGPTCYGGPLIKYCPTMLIPGLFEINTGQTVMLDTRVGTGCTEVITIGTNELCVIAAATITIDGTLRAIGRRPLVLIGTSSLTVSPSGMIDVSNGGAGTPIGCPSASGKNQMANNDYAGGGAGGSFGGAGGRGGAISESARAAPLAAMPVITAVRGGCAGGSGGASFPDVLGAGTGGVGGGAVYLYAPGVFIAGAIDASGGEGRGGGGIVGSSCGGGGGGSGGLIVIEGAAVQVFNAAVLLAQGGGGGGGSNGSTSAQPGNRPQIGSPSFGATGGMFAGSNSGSGGAGAGGVSPLGLDGGNTGSTGGGGGGGGGSGVIFYIGAQPVIEGGAQTYPPRSI